MSKNLARKKFSRSTVTRTIDPIDVVDPSLQSLNLQLSVAHTRGVRLRTAQVLVGALCSSLEILKMLTGRAGGVDLTSEIYEGLKLFEHEVPNQRSDSNAWHSVGKA